MGLKGLRGNYVPPLSEKIELKVSCRGAFAGWTMFSVVLQGQSIQG